MRAIWSLVKDMTNESHFQVEEILPNGVVVGRNGYFDILVGIIFGCIRKSKIVGERENLRLVDLGVVACVSLRLDRVELLRKSIDAIPRGHGAGVHLSDDGMELLAKSLLERKCNEVVSLYPLMGGAPLEAGAG